jgi:hypothetical protein
VTPLSSPDTETERPSRAGFALPRDIIINPKRAFDLIAARPEWLPAYGVVVVILLAALALQVPALLHIFKVADLGVPAPVSPQQDREYVGDWAIEQVILPLFVIGLAASALTVGARLKAKNTTFSLFASLTANCLIPYALGEFASGLAIRAHDPAGFHDLRSLLTALPDNLAVFADPKNSRESDFLSRFNIFEVWSFTLLAFGYARFAGVSLLTALFVTFALNFAFAVTFLG